MSSKFNGVAVLIPSSGRGVSIEWAMSLATFQYPVGLSVAWFLCKGSQRAEQRETLMQRGLEIGAEWLMWIDDDTICPNYTIQQLHYQLNQHPDAAICGGIYCTKTSQPEPLVFAEIGGGPFYNWKLGDVFECKGLGTGCMLIRAAALRDIPQPWFQEVSAAPVGKTATYNGVEVPVTKEDGTDDLYFCRKVTEAGWKILAHGGVLPVHVGQDGKFYSLPIDSLPCRDYRAELEEAARSGKRELVFEKEYRNAQEDGTQVEEGSLCQGA